jgi:hypothetical protein
MRCLTIVTFPTRTDLSRDGLRELMEHAVPRYRGVPDLRRKYFIGGPELSGGVYEWESRAAAEGFYGEEWFARITELYGARPHVQYFAIHALVDNDAGTASVDA